MIKLQSLRGKTELRSIIAGGAIALAVALPAQGAVFVQELDYRASQSMWGGDNSLSFQADGSVSLGPIDVFKYDIGISSGTVSAKHSGSLRAVYEDSLATPGSTTVSLSWAADGARDIFGRRTGGRLQTDLGIYGAVTAAGINVLDVDYSTNIDVRHVPTITDSVSGSDTANGASASIDIFIAEAGAELKPRQTSQLDINSLDGQLAYTRRGSGITQYRPFSLSGGTIDLGFDLGAGIWDFMLASSPVLKNLYTSTFGLDLFLFEEHLTFGGRVRNEKNLGTLVSWAGDGFALDFANRIGLEQFSISVSDVAAGPPAAVPTPGTTALLLIGLGCLIVTRRRSSPGAR